MDKISELPLATQSNTILLERLRLVLLVVVLVTIALLFTLRWAFYAYEPTSFGAELNTTHLHFRVHQAISTKPELDGGLFAPSGLLNVSIDGCGREQVLAGRGTVAPCANAHGHFDHVRLDTLVYGPDSEVYVDVTPGLVTLNLREKEGFTSIRVVFDKDTNEGAQQWAIEPAHSFLKLYLREAESNGLPDETILALTDKSTIYVGNRDDAPVIGSTNKLVIPRLDKNINLRDSRLELMNVSGARIRGITWNRTNKLITSLSTVITGQSNNIAVFSPYSEESSNEALNVFDFYSHGRWGHFLFAVLSSSGLVGLGSLVVSALTFMFSVGTNFDGLSKAIKLLKPKETYPGSEDET